MNWYHASSQSCAAPRTMPSRSFRPTKTVEINQVRVHLTGKEYEMLEFLSLRYALRDPQEAKAKISA